MGFTIRFTEEAREDLSRLYDWLLQRAEGDFTVAEYMLQVIRDGITVLELAPMNCRRAMPPDPFLRELVVGLGVGGCVLLSEVEDSRTTTVLAVRRQREGDY
ncbi:type II toxin-antitoxin system RelE/ParE family toxin [Xanthomonas translucens pv. poae]|uniref:type II toxin-antitoxin system RelE/ParE family toxin n=1 Tax=Xanthomonas graminis TaxID=3390026 RepID=UPI0009B9E8DB|nr:type II toxin-antitoxin system RelE/ParE family toxin [Xanthomonas translucens]UKE63001.1 type II toxin-antitoxin system RelE/ParE family toxin [Xanthomonas translucens pv. poae]